VRNALTIDVEEYFQAHAYVRVVYLHPREMDPEEPDVRGRRSWRAPATA